MKDTESAHKKVQDMIDCYATSDPLKEMSNIGREPDAAQAAAKWVALAALHGVNRNAKKISISRSKDGKMEVMAKYRKADLPTPGSEVGEKIIEAVRGITHLEGEKGETPLAIGIRDGSIEINVKLKKDRAGESVTLKFPE